MRLQVETMTMSTGGGKSFVQIEDSYVQVALVTLQVPTAPWCHIVSGYVPALLVAVLLTAGPGRIWGRRRRQRHSVGLARRDVSLGCTLSPQQPHPNEVNSSRLSSFPSPQPPQLNQDELHILLDLIDHIGSGERKKGRGWEGVASGATGRHGTARRDEDGRERGGDREGTAWLGRRRTGEKAEGIDLC